VEIPGHGRSGRGSPCVGPGAGYGFAPITALGGRFERAAEVEDASEIERSARGLLEYAEKALHALASR
jgi:hypothetical protein